MRWSLLTLHVFWTQLELSACYIEPVQGHGNDSTWTRCFHSLTGQLRFAHLFTIINSDYLFGTLESKRVCGEVEIEFPFNAAWPLSTLPWKLVQELGFQYELFQPKLA